MTEIANKKETENKEVVTMKAMAKVRQFVYDYVNMAGMFGPAIDGREFDANMKVMHPECVIDEFGVLAATMRLVDDSGESPIIHTGYATMTNNISQSIGIITKMRKKKNNKGWVVFFSLVGNTKGSQIKTYVRELEKICLTINETNSGVKLLWFFDKKPCWNIDGLLVGHLYGFENIIWRNIVKEVESIYSIDKFIPIAKYLPFTDGQLKTFGTTVWGLNQYDIKNLSHGTNIKDILNRIYGKDGQLGLTKNAFGGLNRITTLNELMRASHLVRLFKGMPASFFEKMDEIIRHDVESLNYVSVKHMFREMDYFLKYFNRPKIQQEILEYFDKVAKRYVTPDGTAFYIDRLLGLMADSARMLRRIRNRTVRNNILEFRGSIEELHDLIVSEYNKIRQENRKIKYTENITVLNGQRINGTIECVLPYDTHTLVEWGTVQHNCIGSYADKVLKKSSLIVGFKDIDTNAWIGHAEIVKDTHNKWNKVTQLLGKHNTPLDELDDSVIRKFIKNWVINNKEVR